MRTSVAENTGEATVATRAVLPARDRGQDRQPPDETAPRSSAPTRRPSPGHAFDRLAVHAPVAAPCSCRACADRDGSPALRDEDQDPPGPGRATGSGRSTGSTIPTGVELAGNDHRSYSTISAASRAGYRTYVQNQTLMRLLPAGNYRHGCVKEFLTTVSTTCPTTGAFADRNPCSGNKCLDPGRWGRLGTQTDSPDTFFDNHRTRHTDSILEGTGTDECSEVCHQRYKFRAAADRSTYHDLGSFYIIRNFKADTANDADGQAMHVTTGSINKVPAQRAAPSQAEFARDIAPDLATSGVLDVPPPRPRTDRPRRR